MTNTVVIVGSSVGGVSTAQALRTEGFTGRVVLVGGEACLPYDKPPLSKQFLSGEWGPDEVSLLTAEAAERDNIELRLGVEAKRLDVASRELWLADGTGLTYDALVVATGASARPSPWKPDSGLHVIRTLEDSLALQADLNRHDGPVVVVGGGFIGAEVASTARGRGRSVVIVDPLPDPMARVVGADLAPYFTDLHRRHGVTCMFGAGVEEVTGSSGDLQVRLTNGISLSASTVVVGIGAVPNDGWLADSGLMIEDGVVCDEFSRAVDAPDVFAVGDVARWFHPGHRDYVRAEHWTNAVEQATCVAHNIADPGDLRPYRPVEYVWSDQYDWKVQIVGRPARATRHLLIGDLAGAGARGAVIYSNDAGRLCGAVTVNWPKALVQCRRLMGAGAEAGEAIARIQELQERSAAVGPK